MPRNIKLLAHCSLILKLEVFCTYIFLLYFFLFPRLTVSEPLRYNYRSVTSTTLKSPVDPKRDPYGSVSILRVTLTLRILLCWLYMYVCVCSWYCRVCMGIYMCKERTVRSAIPSTLEKRKESCYSGYVFTVGEGCKRKETAIARLSTCLYGEEKDNFTRSKHTPCICYNLAPVEI